MGFALHLVGEASWLLHQCMLLRALCPGHAAAPLPHTCFARVCSQTHHWQSLPLARAQERCWLGHSPTQQKAGGWGHGGFPACGMAAVPPPAPLCAPGETGLPEGGSSLIQRCLSEGLRRIIPVHGGTSRTPGPTVSPGTATATAPQGQSAPVPQANGRDLLPAPGAAGSPRHGCLHRAVAGAPLCYENPTRQGAPREMSPGRRLCRCPEHPQSAPDIPNLPAHPCIALRILNLP